MTLLGLNEEMNQLVGEKVAFKRIAGNSVIVYFFGEPGDASVVSIWLDPTWRYEREGRIVLGSGDLSMDRFPSKQEYKTEFHRLCGLAEPLQASTLLQVAIDQQTSDITLKFSDGQVLRKFANSAYDDYSWVYRNHPNRTVIEVSPVGLVEKTQSG